MKKNLDRSLYFGEDDYLDQNDWMDDDIITIHKKRNKRTRST